MNGGRPTNLSDTWAKITVYIYQTSARRREFAFFALKANNGGGKKKNKESKCMKNTLQEKNMSRC